MHNIVEGALERVNPAVAKSYRDYRNYKLDFIHMMDDVYTKSQAIPISVIKVMPIQTAPLLPRNEA